MKAIGVASRRVVLAALCSHAILPARPSAAALGASAAALGAPRCALGALALPASPAPVPRAASVSCHPQPEPEPRPHPPHRAWNPPAPEYTNSVTASRDTNISPREAYDTIRERASPRSKAEVELGRVLDLGAGAGASTKLLSDIGWREVVAVDPSNLAWERYSAGSALPGGVSFVHASDEQYVNRWRREAPLRKFDAVVINYAINPGKAAAFARELLLPGGRLLAPCNQQDDYWFLQEYVLLNDRGQAMWTQGTVGKWDVIFQPDFTSPTCQGQWCPALRADADARNLRLFDR